jgi:hypothetical protein
VNKYVQSSGEVENISVLAISNLGDVLREALDDQIFM